MKNPETIHDIIKMRHEMLKAIRAYFYEKEYIEVETANLMRTAPPDPYIDPLRVFVGRQGPYYLHTSPEMGMKKLLAEGCERIFQVCKVYRVEESDEVHSTEFTMLEWYRKGTYIDVMGEVEDLARFTTNKLFPGHQAITPAPFAAYDLESLFIEKTGIDPFALDRDALAEALQHKGFAGIDDRDDWNSLFFKLFIQEVEPAIGKALPYFITGWPQSISTMAQRMEDNPMKVERFELYMEGLEIANGYTELLDRDEQRGRFLSDNRERARLGKKIFPLDEEFIAAVGRIRGPYTGVSVGIDRLLMALTGRTRVGEVIPYRFMV